MAKISSRLLLTAACVLALIAGTVISAQRSSSTMASAASAFVNSLSPEQRQKAVFAFQSDERLHWNFIPSEVFPRNGLLLKDMNENQRKLAHDLLKSALSQRGYMTATSIMELENTLGDLERRARESGRGAESMVRDPLKYYFSVFGTPSTKEPWGWRVEGHHVSLHLTVVNGTLVASSPTFFGSNPAEVREGPKKGLRILGEQEDAGRDLLKALNDQQRAKAVIQSVALNEIVTTNKLDINPLSPIGVTAAEMTPQQREMLMKVVKVYTSKMADDIAKDRLAKLEKAGIEKIAFAWAGEAEFGKKHYYRIQGPTFLIEHDNSQNDGNHIHSVWRDFNGDFGRDLLREHVASVPH
jgi:Spy/CpxP family protein refolding chaperone